MHKYSQFIYDSCACSLDIQFTVNNAKFAFGPAYKAPNTEPVGPYSMFYVNRSLLSP